MVCVVTLLYVAWNFDYDSAMGESAKKKDCNETIIGSRRFRNFQRDMLFFIGHAIGFFCDNLLCLS